MSGWNGMDVWTTDDVDGAHLDLWSHDTHTHRLHEQQAVQPQQMLTPNDRPSVRPIAPPPFRQDTPTKPNSNSNTTEQQQQHNRTATATQPNSNSNTTPPMKGVAATDRHNVPPPVV
uniref:Uncharacterized protein n=1 Tax=Globodera rostochiensis TaxID=31243 RepID=A0A914HWE1_GLORO